MWVDRVMQFKHQALMSTPWLTLMRVLLFLALPVSWSCSSAPKPQPKTEVRIGVVPTGYASWTHTLVDIYRGKLDKVFVAPKEIAGSVLTADLLESGRLDVAITGANVAYLAFNNGTDAVPIPHRKLRGMAVLTVSALHFVAGPGVDIKSLNDIKGKRIGVGPAGSGTEFTVNLLLPEFGISLSDVQIRRLPFEQMAPELAHGSLDVGFVQVGPAAPSAKAALAVEGTRLIPITGAAISRLREKYPFFRPVIIPAGTYGWNDDTETIGVDFILACREDLSADLVHDMLKVLFESFPELAKRHPELGTITFYQSPTVPIPLHPGAAGFYRERELLR